MEERRVDSVEKVKKCGQLDSAPFPSSVCSFELQDVEPRGEAFKYGMDAPGIGGPVRHLSNTLLRFPNHNEGALTIGLGCSRAEHFVRGSRVYQ